MFLDSQNEWRTQLERRMRGEDVRFDPGYEERYLAWVKEKESTVNRFSAEESTLSFSDYLEDWVQAELEKLIGEKNLSPEKERELLEQAHRGQLLLVSTDDGAHFDRFLTPEEQKMSSPLNYRILSPSFYWASPDFKTVREAQGLIHVVRKLREQHFLVERAWLEEGEVHVEALHPKHGAYEVRVDLKQVLTLALTYEFINAQGKTLVSEAEIKQRYNMLETENLENKVAQEWAIGTQRDKSAAEAMAQKSLGAALATYVARSLLEQGVQKTPEQKAEEQAALARAQMEKPLLYNRENLPLPPPVAAKAAMKARFARQEQARQNSLNREKDRLAHFQAASKVSLEQKRQIQRAQEKKNQAAQKAFRRKALAGLGAAGGLLTAAGGSAWFIIQVNLLNGSL